MNGWLGYVRWRLGPQGRAAYRGYALHAERQRTLSAAPTRRARARVTGHAARWQDFERPQRGARHHGR